MESEREDKVRKSGKKPACCKQVEGPSQRSPLAWRYTIGEINTYNCFFSFFPGWTLEFLTLLCSVSPVLR